MGDQKIKKWGVGDDHLINDQVQRNNHVTSSVPPV